MQSISPSFFAALLLLVVFTPEVAVSQPVQLASEPDFTKILLNDDGSCTVIYRLESQTQTVFTIKVDKANDANAMQNSITLAERVMPELSDSKFQAATGAAAFHEWTITLPQPPIAPGLDLPIKLSSITHNSRYLVTIDGDKTFAGINADISNGSNTAFPVSGKLIEYTVPATSRSPEKTLDSVIIGKVKVIAEGSHLLNITLGSGRDFEFEKNAETDPLKTRPYGFWVNYDELKPVANTLADREGTAIARLPMKENWPQQLTQPLEIRFELIENRQRQLLDPSIASSEFGTAIAADFAEFTQRNGRTINQEDVVISLGSVTPLVSGLPVVSYQIQYSYDLIFDRQDPNAKPSRTAVWLLFDDGRHPPGVTLTSTDVLSLYVHPVSGTRQPNATTDLSKMQLLLAAFTKTMSPIPDKLDTAVKQLSKLEPELVLASQKIDRRRTMIHALAPGTSAQKLREEIEELTRHSNAALDAYNAMINSYGINLNETNELMNLNLQLP